MVEQMRVAIIGVSHWHLPLYLDPLLQLSDVEVVAVSDPEDRVAADVAQRIGAQAWADWRAMLAAARPDFVFVLGRHVDMAETCRALIAGGVPFAVEKPAGIDAAQVAELANLAEAAGAFAAVPFVFRQSRMIDLISEILSDEEPLYLSFTYVAGSVDRYRGGNEWMLTRITSGGGCLLNLGIHFLDLSRLILGGGVHVVGAALANSLEGLDTEDHASVLLRGDQGTALVETGYSYPAPHMSFDMHFSIRTTRHHLSARDSSGLHVIKIGEDPRFIPMQMTNVPYYPVFVRDVLARAREGSAPVAGLAELVDAFRLVEAAYALSPLRQR